MLCRLRNEKVECLQTYNVSKHTCTRSYAYLFLEVRGGDQQPPGAGGYLGLFVPITSMLNHSMDRELFLSHRFLHLCLRTCLLCVSGTVLYQLCPFWPSQHRPPFGFFPNTQTCSIPAYQKAPHCYFPLVLSFIPALLCETEQPPSSPLLTTPALLGVFQCGSTSNTPQNLFLLRIFNDFRIAQSKYHISIRLCKGRCAGNALGICFPYVALMVPSFIYLTNA